MHRVGNFTYPPRNRGYLDTSLPGIGLNILFVSSLSEFSKATSPSHITLLNWKRSAIRFATFLCSFSDMATASKSKVKIQNQPKQVSFHNKRIIWSSKQTEKICLTKGYFFINYHNRIKAEVNVTKSFPNVCYSNTSIIWKLRKCTSVNK